MSEKFLVMHSAVSENFSYHSDNVNIDLRHVVCRLFLEILFVL